MNRIVTMTVSAALALSPLALTAPTYAAPAKAGAYTVTAKINKTVAIGKETTIKVRGRVTPKAAGQKVVLQQRVGSKKAWKATGTSTVKRDGTYLLKDDPSTAGTRQYRVVKPASDGFAKGFSDTLAVEVYRWGKLAHRVAGPQVNLATAGVNIGTEYFGSSLINLEAGKAASVEYTLGRKCLELRATYALTDESATGSSGAISVTTDGVVRASHPLAVGTVVEDETLDVSDTFRIKFDLSTTGAPAPASWAAVATPEVLCTR
jgi:hypothetical protein